MKHRKFLFITLILSSINAWGSSQVSSINSSCSVEGPGNQTISELSARYQAVFTGERAAEWEAYVSRRILGTNPPQVSGDAPSDCTDSAVVCGLTHIYQSLGESSPRKMALLSFITGRKYGTYISVDQAKLRQASTHRTRYDYDGEYIEYVPYESREATVWSFSEALVIDNSLAKLPKNFHHLGRNGIDVVRFPEGTVLPNHMTAAAVAISKTHSTPGRIVVTTEHLKTHAQIGEQIFLHEVGHHYDFSNRQNNRRFSAAGREFSELSGWQQGLQDGYYVYRRRREASFVTPYAGTNPGEDFAESLAFFVIRPLQLLMMAPSKYTFLKDNVFAGSEYVSTEAMADLEQLGDLTQVASSAVEACLPFLKRAQMHYPRSGVLGRGGYLMFQESDPAFRGYGSGASYTANAFAQNTQCFDRYFIRNFSEDQMGDQCHPKVGSLIKEKAKWLVQGLLEIISNFQNANLDTHDQACRDSGNRNRNCARSRYFREVIGTHSQLSALNSLVKQKLVEKAVSLSLVFHSSIRIGN